MALSARWYAAPHTGALLRASGPRGLQRNAAPLGATFGPRQAICRRLTTDGPAGPSAVWSRAYASTRVPRVGPSGHSRVKACNSSTAAALICIHIVVRLSCICIDAYQRHQLCLYNRVPPCRIFRGAFCEFDLRLKMADPSYGEASARDK